MKNLLFLGITFCLFAFTSIAQEKATVTGVITSGKTKEMLPEVVVRAMKGGSTVTGTRSDFMDGSYTLQLAAGTYTLKFTEFDHEEHTETITLKAGEKRELNLQLKPIQVADIVEIIVEKKAPNTLGALLANKEKAAGQKDGISKEQFEKSGGGTVGDVVKQIPAVSIVGGKDIYVRGLGDRYTKTVLNSMEIPGLDPDKNSVQMDIFPTSVVDNIMVSKTFTPDLQGDFAGGVVDIKTRDFQSKKTFEIKLGLGYNTVASVRSDFLLYEGGKLDFLGFDDGSRKLPIIPTNKVPDVTTGSDQLANLTSSFGGTMAASQQFSGLNQNHGLVFGNDKDSLFNKADWNYGYNLVLNYRNNFNFVENALFSEYRLNTDYSKNELLIDRKSTGSIGEQEVMWSALFGQSFRKKNGPSYSITAFHTQNGLAQAGLFTDVNFESNPSTLEKNSLFYTQRSVSNLNFSGKHTINKWNANWKITPTYSSIQDPDVRSTALSVLDENGARKYELDPSVGAEINRIFRSLSEYNVSARFDMDKTFRIFKDSLPTTVKFGGMNTYKNRTFNVYNYQFYVENDYYNTPNPNEYFTDENLWTPETDRGTYVKGNYQASNNYQASQNISALYAMQTLPVSEKLELVYGARVEKTDNLYTGESQNGEKYTNEKVLDELNVLPSLNVKYRLIDIDSTRTKMNLRAAISKTVARPSFKEKSISQIFDPISGRVYNGNLDLMQTDIYNADLRWEFFFGNAEIISASAFYKRFINPIELFTFPTAPDNVMPINAGEAEMFGFEFELRKQIAFFNVEKRKALYYGFNATYVNTKLDMTKVQPPSYISDVTEYQNRVDNAREGQTIDKYRTMAGQSPFILNSYLDYSDEKTGMNFNVSYNVQGKRLAIVGIGRIPNVYEKPFHTLNLKVSKKFGKDQKIKASISAQNLLNQTRTRVYESFEANSQIYDAYYRGMRFSASVKINL